MSEELRALLKRAEEGEGITPAWLLPTELTRTQAKLAMLRLTDAEVASCRGLSGRELDRYLQLKLLGAQEVDDAGWPIAIPRP